MDTDAWAEVAMKMEEAAAAARQAMALMIGSGAPEHISQNFQPTLDTLERYATLTREKADGE